MNTDPIEIIKYIFGYGVVISPNLYILLDEHFNIKFANNSFLKKFGYKSNDEIIDKNFVSLLNSTSTKNLISKIQEQDSVCNFEITLGEESSKIFFNSNAYKRELNGKYYYLIMMRDITEDIKREMALHKLTLELEDAKNEILQSREKLVQQEKLVSIGMLAAGIAHEINNPLGFIKSNFETLLNYSKMILAAIEKIEDLSKNTPELKDTIKNILKSSKIDFIKEDIADLYKDSEDGFKRIIDIINALKNFSRQELDKKEPHLLSEIIEESLTITHNKTKHIATIDKQIKEDVEVICSKTEIAQVLINLIVNAAQALEEIDKKDKKIIIRSRTDSDFITIEVEDNGPGIPEHIRNKVFDPFFTTKPVGKGTGLGLYISYDIIVNKHNGVLEMETKEGEGTIFRIKLPRNQKNKKIKVLVVDDFESVAEALANGLNSLDKYIADISTSGFDAGVKIHTMKPDVVVLDYHMPGINGYDVAKRIKESNDTKNIKIIVYSGNFDKDIIKNLKALNVDYILHKPFFVDELSQVIDSLFEIGD